MTVKRILGIDLSTKTGYAFVNRTESSIELLGYGTLSAIHEPKGEYPCNYVEWAYQVFGEIQKLLIKFDPEILAIEETVAGSKGVYSQKILEWVHLLLAQYIKNSNTKAVYFLTGSWRSEVGAKMTKEESKHNKTVKEYKKDNKTSIAYDIKGKRIGKLTKKHINIRRANEVFGKFLKEPLRKKDEDTADALLLAYALHLRMNKVSNKKEVTLEDLVGDNL